MELYQRVREIIKKLAPSQAVFADQLGLKSNTLNGYLKKNRQDNLWPHLHRILELYPQINRDWLFHGEEPMFDVDKPEIWAYGSVRLRLHPDVEDDPLGRLAFLTGKRTTSAFVLAELFGTDFKEMKKFISQYIRNRQKRDLMKMEDRNIDEIEDQDFDEYEDEPDLYIPEQWLKYFCRHHIFNWGWIQYGESHGNMPFLFPIENDPEIIALYGEIRALKETNLALMDKLAKEKETFLEETKFVAPLPTDAHSSQAGTKLNSLNDEHKKQ